jgi:hypothetical protein
MGIQLVIPAAGKKLKLSDILSLLKNPPVHLKVSRGDKYKDTS